MRTVWPDLAIYWTLGNFLKPLGTINLPKSTKFLGNFFKSVKIYHFSSEIILGNFYRHLAIFIWSPWMRTRSCGITVSNGSAELGMAAPKWTPNVTFVAFQAHHKREIVTEPTLGQNDRQLNRCWCAHSKNISGSYFKTSFFKVTLQPIVWVKSDDDSPNEVSTFKFSHTNDRKQLIGRVSKIKANHHLVEAVWACT